ncbi:MAG TPA: ATP-binding protein [Thermoanaerobaculia bacterium]|jgi:signal transduction histidine kinase
MRVRTFRDLPLTQKMFAIILAASGATLLITGVAVLTYELTFFQPNALAELEAQVDILRPTLIAAIDFFNAENAAEDLGNLSARSPIAAACVYDRNGNLFADFVENGDFSCPEAPEPAGHAFQKGALRLSKPLATTDGVVGHLFVLRPLPPLLARLPQYALMLAAVVFALLAVSAIMTAALKRLISGPILRLARAAHQVRDHEDYSVRVKKSGDDEVGYLTEAFNQMLATIEHNSAALRAAYHEQKRLQDQLLLAQKMESIGRLAGGVAHDFNNYLTVIVGSAELAMSQLSPESPLQRLLENVRKATTQASNLTRQLLAFARQQIIAPRVIDPNRLLVDMEKMLRSLVGEPVELAVIPLADVWPIRADPNQMSHVLMNLAVNARDAMPEGGKLTIETRNVAVDDADETPEIAGGEYVLIKVTDTGAGMTAAALQHLFEPFFTTKELGKGTGLGLATCYGIVKQSGGHILVDSAPGRGTTFRIFFERSREGAVDRAAVGSRMNLPTGDETVLVVEDNALVRQTAVTLLRAQGYDVLEAAGGPDALRLVEQHEGEIDVLVTDVMMPQMNGKDVAQRLLALRPQLRVLYVSGYAEVIADQGELEEGIEFLQKPYTSEALIRRVRTMLDA